MFEMKCETPAHEISVQTYIKTLDFYASPIKNKTTSLSFALFVNPEKPDVPLNKNDAFQKVQKRRVQEKR